MTNNNKQSGRPLWALIIICAVFLIPSFIIWLLNVELALQSAGIQYNFIGSILPENIYNLILPLTADLSTITTLVPVLLFAFPLFMAIRIQRHTKTDPNYIHRIIYDPYPPHFPFFLVMLGLTGTLYGLLIGLSASGVDEIAASVPSADNIRETVDRLLAGTATALLSSLLGLLGAFLAARPFTWIFRKMAGIKEEESQHSLMETVATLTRDLQTLSHASREFSERLNVGAAERIDQRLTNIDSTINNLTENINQTNKTLDKLVELQELTITQLVPLKYLSELQQLKNIEKHTATTAENLIINSDKLESVRAGQEKITTTAEQLASEIKQSQTITKQSLDNISALLTANNRDNKDDRSALRKAIGHYIENLAGNNE
jgi:hypothetical protein